MSEDEEEILFETAEEDISDSESDTDSDSSSGTSSSESTDSEDYFSDSDTDYNSDQSDYKMKTTDLQLNLTLKWDGAKATYDDFIHAYQDWLLYTNKDQFYSFDIHPKLHPKGLEDYEASGETSKSKRKKMKKLFNDHRKCIAKLRMSVPRAVITGFIDKSITKEWPHGRLWVVLKSMHLNYNTPDKFARRQLRCDIEAIVMFNDDEDPELVYRRLENVQTKYSLRPEIEPTCDDLLVQLIDGSTDRYQTLYATKMAIMDEGHVFTQEDIDDFQRSAMVLYLTAVFPRKKKKKGGNHSFKDAKGNDIALFAAPGKKGNKNGKNGNSKQKFDGECYHCGKKGHKANQCWEKDKSRKGKSNKRDDKTGGKSKCEHCGKPGHSEKFCWEKECNAH